MRAFLSPGGSFEVSRSRRARCGACSPAAWPVLEPRGQFSLSHPARDIASVVGPSGIRPARGAGMGLALECWAWKRMRHGPPRAFRPDLRTKRPVPSPGPRPRAVAVAATDETEVCHRGRRPRRARDDALLGASAAVDVVLLEAGSTGCRCFRPQWRDRLTSGFAGRGVPTLERQARAVAQHGLVGASRREAVAALGLDPLARGRALGHRDTGRSDGTRHRPRCSTMRRALRGGVSRPRERVRGGTAAGTVLPGVRCAVGLREAGATPTGSSIPSAVGSLDPLALARRLRPGGAAARGVPAFHEHEPRPGHGARGRPLAAGHARGCRPGPSRADCARSAGCWPPIDDRAGDQRLRPLIWRPGCGGRMVPVATFIVVDRKALGRLLARDDRSPP